PAVVAPGARRRGAEAVQEVHRVGGHGPTLPTGGDDVGEHVPYGRAVAGTEGSTTGADRPGRLRVDATCVIDASEITWRFTTSGGPGGQHANKAATRAEARFDVEAS